MTDQQETSELSKAVLEEQLRDARSRIAQLESELAETNEGMVALTIELENAKDRYQILFERGTDAILLVDPEKKSIHDVNQTACELFGYDRDELLSLTMADLFPDENDQFGTLAGAMVHGWGGDHTGRTKQGRTFTADLSASKVTLHGKLYLLMSLRDVTMRKQREQRLQVLTRVFRHNLRNDGNVIQGYAELLGDSVADPSLEAFANKIEANIDRLLEMSGKVRRIQETVERDHSHWVSIGELLDRMREWFDESESDGTLTITTPEHGLLVEEDLGIAIQETIDNSLTHGGDSPEVRLSVAVNDDQQRIRIEVTDDGPGIPDHELDALQSGTETPLVHGSGIGLWSIYWVVDTLGGELTVQSSEDGGTILTMEVPYEPADTEGS